MVPLAADNDLHGAIVRGLLRRGVDVLRLVDARMADRPDDEVLEWAAGEGRVLVTQDVQTMIGCAWERVRAGLPMRGVIVRDPHVIGIGQAIDELEVIAKGGDPEDFKDQVIYLPW